MLPKVPVRTAVSRGGTLIADKTVKNGQPVYTFRHPHAGRQETVFFEV